MLLIFIRTSIIFLIMFTIMRLMGKRQIGEMQPFEFVITLLIADLACIPMADVSIPLIYGITAIITLFIIHQLFALLGKKSIIMNRLLSSRPSIVIDSQGVNFDVLKKLNISIDELQENLRNKGYSNFDEVEYVIVETNGKFSILEKSSAPPLTSSDSASSVSGGGQQQQDTQQKGQQGGSSAKQSSNNQQDKSYKTPLPVCIIEEGKFVKWEMERLKIDYDFIRKTLKDDGCGDISKVLVATLDNNGKMYYQAKGQPYKTIMTDYKGADW